MRRALTRFLPLVIGTALVGAMVHVVSVLLLPSLAQDSAVMRLGRGGAINQMEVLQPGGGSAHEVPFADPFMQMAICRFDLGTEPVRLRIFTGDFFMSLLVMADTGRIQLGLTDKAASRRQLDVVLATPAQIRQLESQDLEDEPVQELRLRMNQPRGLVVVKALRPLASDGEAVTALLERARCEPLRS